MGKRKKKPKVVAEIPEIETPVPVVEPTPEEEPVLLSDNLVGNQIVPDGMGDIYRTIALLPELQKYSQRWYGETFTPQYNAARSRLRELAGL